MLCPQLRSQGRDAPHSASLPSPATSPDADFIARRTSPGVIRWFDFNDVSQLGSGAFGAPFGYGQGSGPPYGYPVIDPNMKASGVASMRFDIPDNNGNQNPSGIWFTNFSDDFSWQVDTGQTVYIQMRVRWNQQYYNQVFFGGKDSVYADCGVATIIDATHFSLVGDWRSRFGGGSAARGHNAGGAVVYYAKVLSSVYSGGVTTITADTPAMGDLSGVSHIWSSILQAGIKFFDITAGDIIDGGGRIRVFGSSAETKMVVQTYYQTRSPQVYSYQMDGATTGAFHERYGTSDFMIQNSMPSPFCLYSKMSGKSGPINGCFNMAPDEWITLQLRVTPGPRAQNVYAGFGDVWTDCKVQLWAANEGQPSQLLIDWDNTKTGWYDLPAWVRNSVTGLIYAAKFGKLWLFPYRSYSDALQTFPGPGAVWYDEVIISTQRIPDPSGFPVYPAWRTAMSTKDTWYQIAGTANMSNCYSPPWTNQYYLVDGWIGFAASANSWFVPASGGHITYLGQNGVQKIDFSQDAPVWTVDYLGTPNPPAMTTTGSLTRYYYADGNPCSRHSYYANWYVPQRDSVFMFYDGANYDGTSSAADTVDRYDCVTKLWDLNGINTATSMVWPKSGCFTGSAIRVPMCCVNPATGDAFVGNSNSILRKWTQTTATWADWPVWLPEYPGQFHPDWSYSPSLVDVARNRIVVANQSNRKFEYCDLAGGNLARSPLTTIEMYESGIVHDLDNDRYVLIDRWGNVFAIDPTTWAVTSLPFSSVTSMTGGSPNGVFTRLTYFADLGGIAYAPKYADNIYFMPTR